MRIFLATCFGHDMNWIFPESFVYERISFKPLIRVDFVIRGLENSLSGFGEPFCGDLWSEAVLLQMWRPLSIKWSGGPIWSFWFSRRDRWKLRHGHSPLAEEQMVTTKPKGWRHWWTWKRQRKVVGSRENSRKTEIFFQAHDDWIAKADDEYTKP